VGRLQSSRRRCALINSFCNLYEVNLVLIRGKI
jgi:hypothetical protein